MQIAEIT